MKYVIEVLENEIAYALKYAQVPKFVKKLSDVPSGFLTASQKMSLERIPQIQEAIKILNAQNESQNVTGNESQKKDCFTCEFRTNPNYKAQCDGCNINFSNYIKQFD